MIKVDASDISAVVFCTRCHWRTIRPTRGLAYAVGLNHQQQVHPDDVRGTKTADELARRHRRI